MSKLHVAVAVAGLTGTAAADVINIPGDQPTIQARRHASRDIRFVLARDVRCVVFG